MAASEESGEKSAGASQREVFFRLESPTQTRKDAIKQVASGQIWGRAARWSNIPSVKAYRGNRDHRRGVEFTTPCLLDLASSSPYEARWYYPQTAGTECITQPDPTTGNPEDYAIISAVVTNCQP
jgi:hypothetical protein